MKKTLTFKTALFLFVILLSGCQLQKENTENIKILPPEELYGQLFIDVQSHKKNILGDSKAFVDCVPKGDIEKILADYSKLENKSDSTVIRNFLEDNFIIPGYHSEYKTDSSQINDHITEVWSLLKRQPDEVKSGTLIPLKYSYIVPGGRFREVYYWDSYFTMLGLQEDKQTETIQNMVDNFSNLIDTYGFVPNGNRTYYLSRSQPPFYALMITLLAEIKGDSIYKNHLENLEKEYSFWMNGTEKLSPTNNSYRRVVRMKDGETLNRYWDDKNTPRAESYKEDIQTAKEAKSILADSKDELVYRNIRAAAESGWDFSSRWLTVNKENIYELYTIHTTDIIPVDLNSLLYNLEYTISKAYQVSNNNEKSKEYRTKYNARKEAILKYCWSSDKKFFMDYNFVQNKQTEVYSLAGVYPLFFDISDKKQAALVSAKIQHSFLKAGGVVSTLNTTDQQWDAPNGWAPLQWITIQGLRNYGYLFLANDIKKRWLNLNEKVYNNTFKMLEKYNVVNTNLKSGGGEYPTQDGFGWTNGVYQSLSKE